LDDADTAGKKLGNDRAEKESYLFKSLLDSNALVAFGSDWPVSIFELLASRHVLYITYVPNYKPLLKTNFSEI